MKGVKFGEHHSYDSWGLLMSPNWEIGLPEIKEKKIDIEGADGELDYTEYFGGVKYGNRKLKFEFIKPTLTDAKEFMRIVSDIVDDLHGQKMQIVLDDDKEFFYLGRARITGFSVKQGIGTVEIEADCDPYKMKIETTTLSSDVSGTMNFELHNMRKSAVPEITATAPLTIMHGANTYSVGAGTFRIPELQLKKGENLLTVTGTGNIKFEYREGRL